MYAVRFRAHRRGARWRTVGTAATYAAALAFVRGAGDFHITQPR